MPGTPQGRRFTGLLVAAVVVAVVATGCGRRGAAAAGTPTQDPGAPAATVGIGQADPSGLATPSPAPSTPAPSALAAATPPPATPAPLATPDLSSINQLLADLDAALGADATADTDEGSTP